MRPARKESLPAGGSGYLLLRRQGLRQAVRGLDAKPFMATTKAAFERQILASDREYLGEETQQVLIGPAFHRRRGDADPQLTFDDPHEFIPARPGLHPEVHQEIRPIPAVTGVHRNLGTPVMASSRGTTNISSTIRPIMAAMGERSTPAMGGRKRRTGRRMG